MLTDCAPGVNETARPRFGDNGCAALFRDWPGHGMLVQLTLTSPGGSARLRGMRTAEPNLAKRGYHHGDLRAVLVEATRRLVEENGPDHVSIAAACRLAGVSTAAPYKHFRDKTEMLNAVALDGMERQRVQMLAALGGLPEGSPGRIAALGRVYVTFAIAEPGVFRLMFALSGEHEDDPALMEKGGEVFALVKREVAGCIGRDEDSEETERRALMLWSFVHGLSFLTIDGKVARMFGEVEVDPLLDDVARRVVWSGEPA